MVDGNENITWVVFFGKGEDKREILESLFNQTYYSSILMYFLELAYFCHSSYFILIVLFYLSLPQKENFSTVSTL